MVNKIQNKKKRPKEQIKEEKVKQKKKVQKNNQSVKKKQADVQSARIKKAKIKRKLLTWISLLAMLIGIIVFLCQSELFAICIIETTGNTQIPQETIKTLSELEIGNNIFLSNTSKAVKNISQNPYIQEVKVNRVLPDKIRIEIVEKQKVYMLQLENEIAYIDKDGNILELTNIKLNTLIALEGYTTPKEEIEAGKKLNEKDIEKLEDIEKILNNGEKIELQNKITSVNIQDKNDYKLNLGEHKKIIYIGDTSNLANKMLYLEAILDKTVDKEGKIFVNGNLNKGFNPYFREEPNS